MNRKWGIGNGEWGMGSENNENAFVVPPKGGTTNMF
jgi:hypothetical protein